MKKYQATRAKTGQLRVEVNGQPLSPRFDIRIRNPEGFECGFPGEGAAQLSLALLADYFGNDHSALELYEWFKWNVIARLPRDGWTLTTLDVEQKLQQIKQVRYYSHAPA